MHTVITGASVINEADRFVGGVWIENRRIKRIFRGNEIPCDVPSDNVIDAQGKILMPGIIDDHVHFREPGLVEKGDIYTESRAAAAGGVTSFMDMPNTLPATVSVELSEQKYESASRKSLINYSFYLGATNDNIDEIKKIDPENVCGLKLFMGSSTGNMLVDNARTLSAVFAESPVIVTVHCEDEQTILENTEKYKKLYGDDIPVRYHPSIRSGEACLRSLSKAVESAHRYGARLHALHLSTGDEVSLFDRCDVNHIPKITSEVCVHHLRFCDEDYERLGTKIKCNPAIKSYDDRSALRNALNDGKIAVISSDHAPHALSEKRSTYFKSPSGIPLIRHSLQIMFELVAQGVFTPETVVMRMCHMPALLFGIEHRGFIREGYYADLILVDTDTRHKATKENILYKCGWSPFEGDTFTSAVTHTWVNGKLVYEYGKPTETSDAMRLKFNR